MDSQTELATNTYVAITETRAIVSQIDHNTTNTHVLVSEIHRTVVRGQEVEDSKNLLVGGTRSLFTVE
jgi:hypothetical protein